MELITEHPVERLAILHTTSADVEAFRDEMLRRLPHLKAEDVSVSLVGASVGPHLGPGCVGAVVLYRPGSASA
jgi:fatty acid-binding protein DegV